jgi:CubicO group peptidase (beta-lactamase class C family)
MSLRYRSILAALALVVFLPSARLFAQKSEAHSRKLDSLIAALDSHAKFMGTFLVAKNGEPQYERSIGVQSLSKKTKSFGGTEYRIGSASKMFTASMIFQLIQEGKLSLSTTLDQFFPQIPNAAKITIGEMLSHHSGIHDLTRDTDYVVWMTKPRSKDQLVATIAAGAPAFAPGAQGEYSNSNYILLGYIVESVTKKPYSDALSERITKPLKLSHTYYGGAIGSHPNEAASFTREGDAWVEGSETDMSIPGGAGAIVSNVEDLSKFITALLQGRVVADSSLAVMTKLTDRYGMGLFAIPFFDRVAYGHSGHIDNFTSTAMYFPDDSVSVVVLSNGGDVAFNGVLIGVLSSWYGAPYEIPSFKEYVVALQKLKEYEGTYGLEGAAVKITVKVDEGALFAQATGQGAFPLEATDEDRFQFDAAGIAISFHRDAAHAVTGFAIKQGGSTTEFTKE